MPVVGPALSGAIATQFAARRFTGRDIINISNSVGSAVANYLVIPNLVTCTVSGLAGPVGSIMSTGVVGIVPTAMSGIMTAKALSVSKRLTGRDASSFFSAISMGLFQILSTMFLTGNSVGCAVGLGTGRFTALSVPALSNLIYAELQRRRMTGRDARNIADCVAFGLVNHLTSSTTFIVSVVGAAAPVPPVGPVSVFSIPSIYTKII